MKKTPLPARQQRHVGRLRHPGQPAGQPADTRPHPAAKPAGSPVTAGKWPALTSSTGKQPAGGDAACRGSATCCRGGTGQTGCGQPQALLDKLLPDYVKPRSGWRDDLVSAFSALQIPHSAENYCAVIAVIEQESTFQADPVVPGLPKIVWGKIGDKAGNYYVPLPVVKTALLKKSPNGQSYKERIDNLRTEKEMNDLFEDMSAEGQKLGLPVGMKNPIRTGGPCKSAWNLPRHTCEPGPTPTPAAVAFAMKYSAAKVALFWQRHPAAIPGALYRHALSLCRFQRRALRQP